MGINWLKGIVPLAATTISGYDTQVTLRQLYYQFISDGTLPSYSEPKGNKTANQRNIDVYKGLGKVCARARRDGYGPWEGKKTPGVKRRRESVFPRLTDDTRALYNTYHEENVSEALNDLLAGYRLDRQIGQENYIYLGVEKVALKELLISWFEEYGFPVIVLKGSSSQDYVERVKQHIRDTGAGDASFRMPHLIYAGDFDPMGESIEEDFCKRVEYFGEKNYEFARACKVLGRDDFTRIHRVAVLEDQILPGQILPVGLPTSIDAKPRDNNLPKFRARHQEFFDEHFNGRALQIETDAVPPDKLRELFWDAITPLWDEEAYKKVLECEVEDRTQLKIVCETENITHGS
jgi:hypothetical protein